MMKAVIAATILAALTSAGHAEIDFTAPLLDERGALLWECGDQPAPGPGQPCMDRRDVTLGSVAFHALAAPDPAIKPEEGFRRGQLGLRIWKARSVDLPAEDIALIKALIAKAYGNSPLLLARCWPLLDPTMK